MVIENMAERRERFIRKLGKKTGQSFSNGYDSLIFITRAWRIYSELFRAYPQRIAVLNEASGITAFFIQECLFDIVIVRLCRLTDPSNQGRNKNLTLSSLGEDSRLNEDEEFNALLREVSYAMKKIRRYRNSSLVHQDIQSVSADKPDVGFTYGEVDLAISAIKRTLRRAGTILLETHYTSSVISEASKDEVNFINVLHAGLVQETVRHQQIKDACDSGNYDLVQSLVERDRWLTDRKFETFD